MTETKFTTSQAWEAFVRLSGLAFALFIVVLFYFSLDNPVLLAIGCFFSSVIIILLMLASVAHSMLYGRKRIILVLRRFHRTEVGAVISAAYRKRLKRGYRLVTLYDAVFPRVGSSARFQTVVWISMPLMWLVASLVPFLLAQAFPILPLFTDNNAFAFAVIQFILPFYLSFGLFINLTFLLALVSCLVLHRWRIYRRTMLTILKAEDLSGLSYSVWSLGSWMMAARMMGAQSTVVEVKSELWQEAVVALASVAQGILIDVSDQSENLLWEVKYCTDHHADKTVFICSDRSLDAESLHLKHLHVGEVLRYGSVMRENRVFANELRVALDGTKLGKRYRPRYCMRYIARDALLIPMMYLTIFCSTQMLSSHVLLGDSILLPRFIVLLNKYQLLSLRELADLVQEERKKAGE